MTLRQSVQMTLDQWADLRLAATRRKPQATIERAMGYLAKYERDIGPETGDALAILAKAHGQVMRERDSQRGKAA